MAEKKNSASNPSSEVAEQILIQLGGRQFVAITGSSHFLTDRNSLEMRLIRNKSGANRLRITLRGDDLYDMCFSYYRAARYQILKHKVVEIPEAYRAIKSYEGIFCDQLWEIFTEVTGLETRMPRIIFD